MKIIEEHHGKQIKCDNCQSILEYLETDIIQEETNYHRFNKYIICPVCSSKKYIVKN